MISKETKLTYCCILAFALKIGVVVWIVIGR